MCLRNDGNKTRLSLCKKNELLVNEVKSKDEMYEITNELHLIVAWESGE